MRMDVRRASFLSLSATFVVLGSTIEFDTGYGPPERVSVNRGTMTYSRLVGNGVGSGLRISGTFDVSWSDLLVHETAILTSGSGAVSVTNSNLGGNTGFNLRNPRTVGVSAPGNYWGTTSEPEIRAKIFDGWDDLSYGFVDYSGFLIAPRPGTGPR